MTSSALIFSKGVFVLKTSYLHQLLVSKEPPPLDNYVLTSSDKAKMYTMPIPKAPSLPQIVLCRRGGLGSRLPNEGEEIKLEKTMITKRKKKIRSAWKIPD